MGVADDNVADNNTSAFGGSLPGPGSIAAMKRKIPAVKEQEKKIESRLTEKIHALAMKVQGIGKGGKQGGPVWRGAGWQGDKPS